MKKTHRDHHHDFDILCTVSKTVGSLFFTDCSFIFSFYVEPLDIGFYKGSLFLEMLSSIGVDLSVILFLMRDSH